MHLYSEGPGSGIARHFPNFGGVSAQPRGCICEVPVVARHASKSLDVVLKDHTLRIAWLVFILTCQIGITERQSPHPEKKYACVNVGC